jgi:hypothetical protein
MALNWTGGLLFASEDDDFYWTSIAGWPGHHVTQQSYLFSLFLEIQKIFYLFAIAKNVELFPQYKH